MPALRALPPFPRVASLILALRNVSNLIAKLVPAETVNDFEDPPASNTAPLSEIPKATGPSSPEAPSPNDPMEVKAAAPKGKERAPAEESAEEYDERPPLTLTKQVVVATKGLGPLANQYTLCNPMVSYLTHFSSSLLILLFC